jgi:hypothetical protein
MGRDGSSYVDGAAACLGLSSPDENSPSAPRPPTSQRKPDALLPIAPPARRHHCDNGRRSRDAETANAGRKEPRVGNLFQRSIEEARNGKVGKEVGKRFCRDGKQCNFRRLSSAVGGAEGDRTPDLVIANDALSQLSYSPVRRKRSCMVARVGVSSAAALHQRG